MCQQKEDLLLAYTEALNTLLGHLRLQSDAISSGDPDYGRYDGVIEAAERRKQTTSHAYCEHAEHHGCGFPLHLSIDSARGQMIRARNLGNEDLVTVCPAGTRPDATVGVGA